MPAARRVPTARGGAARTGGDLPIDRASAARWMGYIRTVLWPYFRPQVMGTEHLPPGRGLIIGCHSGVIPYDAAVTLAAIHERTGRLARAIGDNMFGQIGFVEDFLRRQGALVGRPDVVERMLRAGNLVLVFPGGALDMERPYLTQRYHVVPHRGFAPGRGGYIKLALRTRSPIVPLAIVGAEEAHVLLGTVPPIARLIRFPYFPIVLFPIPLPVKLYIRFGEPIVLPGTARDADDQHHVDGLNRMVRRRVQQLITDTVRRRHGIIFSSYDDRESRRAADPTRRASARPVGARSPVPRRGRPVTTRPMPSRPLPSAAARPHPTQRRARSRPAPLPPR